VSRAVALKCRLEKSCMSSSDSVSAFNVLLLRDEQSSEKERRNDSRATNDSKKYSIPAIQF
jgi:hypothetical protein